MKITETATNAIIGVMKKKGLDPKKTFLEVGLFEGNLGMTFSRDRVGRTIQFGDLTVVVQNNVDSDGVVIDFGEVNGRMGLIFLTEEQYVNHSNREGNQGSQEGNGGAGVQSR